MAARQKPPRLSDVDDFLDLGERRGEKGRTPEGHIPVLILEKSVREGGEGCVANYVRTKDVARRLVSSGLVGAFKPKGTSGVPCRSD